MGMYETKKGIDRLRGQWLGEFFDVLRPNYNGPDDAPVLIKTGLRYRCEPTFVQEAEPKFRELDYYKIYGDRNVIQSGDILVKTIPDGVTPAVTVLTDLRMKSVIGMRTSRIGMVTNSFDEPVHLNVYFDFLGIGFPGSTIERKIEDSLRIPSTRVVIYNRPDVFRLGMQIIETDSPEEVSLDGEAAQQFQKKWVITGIDHTGNVMILTVDNNLKR